MKILLLILPLILIGCSTNTGDPAKDRKERITNAVLEEVSSAAVKIALSAGEGAVNGWAIQNGASAIFATAQNPISIDGGAAVAHIISAAAGPATAVPLANRAGELYASAAPITAADKALVLNTIAAGLQKGAAQVIYSDGQP